MKIDVAICAFNEEERISCSLKSVLQQPGINRVYVLNDASTDGTDTKIKELLHDDRIIYIKKRKNGGLAKGLNEILRYSSADFIARHDADDLMLPGRIECQRAILLSNPEIDILSNGAIFTKKNRYIKVSKQLNNCQIQTALSKSNPIVHPSVMMRRKSILGIGGYDVNLRRAQDYDLWLRASKAGLKFYQDPTIVVNYKCKKKSLVYKILEIKSLYKISKKYKLKWMFAKSILYLAILS